MVLLYSCCTREKGHQHAAQNTFIVVTLNTYAYVLRTRIISYRKNAHKASRVEKHRCHPAATEALLGRRNEEKTAVVMPKPIRTCSVVTKLNNDRRPETAVWLSGLIKSTNIETFDIISSGDEFEIFPSSLPSLSMELQAGETKNLSRLPPVPSSGGNRSTLSVYFCASTRASLVQH